MKLLFDRGARAPIKGHLDKHQVATAAAMGWSTLENGELLSRAESSGFEACVATDQNLKHQQNLSTRKMAFVVLSTTSWPRIEAAIPLLVDAIDRALPGSFVELVVP
ncbi:MAG: hypothetical protein FJ253_12000 [Phycisphaerae bacterium]|nr:hypothetical protein [Phycisphaerae bacterium]